MTDYIVSSDSTPESLIAKGAEIIIRCRDCDNYKYGFCFRFVNGSMCKHQTSPDRFCAWAEPKR